MLISSPDSDTKHTSYAALKPYGNPSYLTPTPTPALNLNPNSVLNNNP